MRWILQLLIFILITFNLSAFAASDKALVIIKKFKFIPQEITIKRDQTVQWENQEKRQYHSVWFEALGEEEPDDYLFAGDSYERQFKETGSFPYRCGPHPEMIGTVHVTN
ncbi:MAG: plastocyanin/azurin family copper-binding protein [Gammaproteobacteria bacterium]